MKKLALALILTMLFQSLGFSASEWDKSKPAGTDDRSDIDTIIQVNNEAVDRLVSNYRRGMGLAYASTSTLTVGIGEITCSNAAGTVRRFRANTTVTTLTWADIDTGTEANSTTYYVYAVADADATTATFKISASATTPTGATYYKRLGSFYNNSSGNIDSASVTNDASSFRFLDAEVRVEDTVYQALTDGFFIGIISGGDTIGAWILAYTDSSNPPTTLMGSAGVSGGCFDPGCLSSKNDSFCIPIKKGNYYKSSYGANYGTGTRTYYFIQKSE